jgi:hypothetical protein
VRVARRVRRAGRGNPPGVSLTGRPGPTQLALTDPGDLIEPPGQVQQRDVLSGAAGSVAAADQPAGDTGRRGTRDGGQLLPDRLVQPGDLLVDRVDQPQVRADLEGVDVAESAGQRGFQHLAGGLQPLVPQRGQRLRAALPGDQGVQEPAAADSEQIRDHHRDLQQRVLEDLLHPVLVAGLVLGQSGPGAGQRPQVPDRLRRHERAAQHAPLVQLAVPHAVEPVALTPPGQVLDVAGVDQPHLQPGSLSQVVPDAPVVAGALQHQPLDALAPQVVHQRGHLPEGGPHLPHLLPPPIRAGTRNPGAHHPRPLGHVDRRRVLHYFHAVLDHLRAITAVLNRTDALAVGVRLRLLLRGHAASLSLRTCRNEAARGAAREKPNLIGVLEATVPSPHDRPQRQTGLRARSTNEDTASRAAHADHAPAPCRPLHVHHTPHRTDRNVPRLDSPPPPPPP